MKYKLPSARAFSRTGALTVTAIGLAALGGWLLDIGLLKSLAPGLNTMKANTALGFTAAGLALYLIVCDPNRRRIALSRGLAAGVLLLGAATLIEHIFSKNLGIDELLFRVGDAPYAGRMSPAAAFIFMLQGAALLSIGVQRSFRLFGWATWLTVPALFISALALVGYAYSTDSLYRVWLYSSMAVHTAFCFCLLSLSILAAVPTRGFVVTFFGNTSGGVAARQLLPTVPLALFAAGGVCLIGERAGWYDARFGLCLMVTLSLVISAIGISLTCTKLHSMDLGRQQAVGDIVALNVQLEQKNRALEAAGRTKSDFLAAMSHELRTPLNAIIGFSELLKNGLAGNLTEEQGGYVGHVFGSGKHLLALVDDVLDLSNIESGSMSLNLDSMPVSLLLRDSLECAGEQAARRQIRLSIDEHETLPPILADVRKVRQMLDKLLSNAIKFNKERGQVVLRAELVPREDVGRPSSQGNRGRSLPLVDSAFTQFMKVSVTDSGIGISPDELEHLFMPFSQLDSGLGRQFEGTGLGLVLVKRLAELHGGTVGVESTLSEGSCFIFWLPHRVPDEEAPI